MDNEELLEQLADIHLPIEISYWRPAPGWWILALFLLLAISYLVKAFITRRHLQKICRAALAELDKCYDKFAAASSLEVNESKMRYINEVNSVLKRVAMVHYSHSEVAGLGGRGWVDFIKEKGDSSLLNPEIAEALSFGRFQTQCEFDAEALNKLGHSWINSLYLTSNRQPSTSREKTN